MSPAGLNPDRWQDPTICVECEAPLPPGHKYRCAACVAAAYARVARGELGIPTESTR